MVDILPAQLCDLDQVLNIAAARRLVYADFQPRFWRPASDARELQREHLASLLPDRRTGFLVARTQTQVTGFVIARLVSPPPVYDPGGLTCLVDDFAVSDSTHWKTLGPRLLAGARDWARERGASQIVVVTATRDEPKREALAASSLSPASEWWVGEVDGSPGQRSRRTITPE